MSIWARVRLLWAVAVAVVVSVALLMTPVAAVQAMPSPAGASVAAACLIALAVPVVAAAGCARSDPRIEAVAVRPVRALDFSLVAVAIVSASAASALVNAVGLAPVGLAAARACLTYAGLLLFGRSLADWRVAPLLPTAYLALVAVVGGGEDIIHPAWWAWIAADPSDAASWFLTVAMLAAGTATYWTRPPRMRDDPDET